MPSDAANLIRLSADRDCGDDPRVQALLAVASPTIVLDESGRVTFCNLAAAALLGCRRDEIEGTPWAQVRSTRQDDLPSCRNEQLYDASGRGIGSVLFLSGGADEVSELRDANRRKDEFLAVLAHELRNPLAPLRNGIHLANAVGMGDSAMKPLLAMMDRQVGVLSRLVDDLLDVSRVGSGKLQLVAEPLLLQEIVADSCDLVRDRFAKTSHRLELDIVASPCPLTGDRDRLQQVFVNLLSNAAKYSDGGSPVRVRLTADDDWARVVVEDEGVGLDLDDTQEIFNMYSQIRLHQARAQGGLGIGLALVKRLVELHGGTVDAESDGPGRGSRFTVRLPLSTRG